MNTIPVPLPTFTFLDSECDKLVTKMREISEKNQLSDEDRSEYIKLKIYFMGLQSMVKHNFRNCKCGAFEENFTYRPYETYYCDSCFRAMLDDARNKF